jgi:hypothetical protein
VSGLTTEAKIYSKRTGVRVIGRYEMLQIIKEFLMIFILLFLVISGLLFGWSAVHGQYEEKTISYPVNPQKGWLIIA